MSRTKKEFVKGKGYIPQWFIPFPIDDINQYFEDGGVPSGSIIQLQSDGEGTFKSTLSLQLAAQAQKQGMNVAYVDAENAVVWYEDEEGVDRCKWFEDIGLDSSEVYYVPNDFQEQLYEDIKRLIREYDVKFVVIDSIPSLEPETIHEREAGESIIGLRAKINTAELIKLTGICREHHATICGINHKKDVITNQGSMGKKAVGGKGWGFYSQLILVNKRTTSKSKLEGHDIIDLSVYIEKNKFGKSFVEIPVKVKQGKGITEDYDLFQKARQKKLIVKKGAGWYRWTPSDEPIAQGDDQIMNWVSENNDLIKEHL